MHDDKASTQGSSYFDTKQNKILDLNPVIRFKTKLIKKRSHETPLIKA